MELEQIFSKPLTHTDITSRLAIPTGCLERFPKIPEGDHSIQFTAIDLEGRPWPLCLSKREVGHPKPVLNGQGWLAFVKAKFLREEDIIIFSRDADEAKGVIFRIKAFKTMRLMGEDISVFV